MGHGLSYTNFTLGLAAGARAADVALAPGQTFAVELGINPIVTSQYSSTTLYQVYYHIQ